MDSLLVIRHGLIVFILPLAVVVGVSGLLLYRAWHRLAPRIASSEDQAALPDEEAPANDVR